MGGNNLDPILTTENRHKWVRNLWLFLGPVGLLYTTSILGIIQQPDHNFSWNDLIPTRFVQGGIAVYLLSSIQDFIRKFMASD